MCTSRTSKQPAVAAAVSSGAEDRSLGTPLPEDFKPMPYTVLVGRGNESREALGNKRLRVLASSSLVRYSNSDKRTKTRIVKQLISTIRNAGGAFVKKSKDGKWHEIEDLVAREKVGYIFRDLLSDRYKSSSKSRVAKREKQITEGRATNRLQRARILQQFMQGQAKQKLGRAIRQTYGIDEPFTMSQLLIGANTTNNDFPTSLLVGDEANDETCSHDERSSRSRSRSTTAQGPRPNKNAQDVPISVLTLQQKTLKDCLASEEDKGYGTHESERMDTEEEEDRFDLNELLKSPLCEFWL